MSKAMLVVLALTAVLAVQANATVVQTCGTGATDSSSVILSDCTSPPCRLTRGGPISISIKFTPTSTVNSLTTSVTAKMQGTQQPLPEYNNQNACNNIVRASDNVPVPCPLSSGVQYIYKNEGTLGSHYHAVESRLHWGLQVSGTDVACFEVDIVLV